MKIINNFKKLVLVTSEGKFSLEKTTDKGLCLYHNPALLDKCYLSALNINDFSEVHFEAKHFRKKETVMLINIEQGNHVRIDYTKMRTSSQLALIHHAKREDHTIITIQIGDRPIAEAIADLGVSLEKFTEPELFSMVHPDHETELTVALDQINCEGDFAFTIVHLTEATVLDEKLKTVEAMRPLNVEKLTFARQQIIRLSCIQ